MPGVLTGGPELRVGCLGQSQVVIAVRHPGSIGCLRTQRVQPPGRVLPHGLQQPARSSDTGMVRQGSCPY